MPPSWKDAIYLQREQLAAMLREPIAQLAAQCATAWFEREGLNGILRENFCNIPHCTYLYCVGTDAVQICDNAGQSGLVPGHFGRDRSNRPYMREPVPSWGFLLSDAYISLISRRPTLTALQAVHGESGLLGYLGADFDLRNLPVTAAQYQESSAWRQVRGDPVIRESVMAQCRVESPMDRQSEQAFAIIEELMADRGVFQCMIHFSSSQATIWTRDDPLRYRILDNEALGDPDICLVYPAQAYPDDAAIPQDAIVHILETLRTMRMADENIYLRIASINLFNGMISLTFSCDGTHYMRYDELLSKSTQFWFGGA
jgi:hypothetical protein